MSHTDFTYISIKSRIVAQIMAALEQRKMNISRLAADMGVSRQSAHQMLQSDSGMSLKSLLKICKTLNIDLVINLEEKK